VKLLPAAALVLATVSPAVAASEDERSGPPLKQRTERGTSGPFTYEVFAEEYVQSRELSARRHPYAGVIYFTKPFKYAVMQGQGVYRFRDRPLDLIHNYICDQPAGTAEIPWTCQATVFVQKGSQPWRLVPEGLRPHKLEEEGVALIAEKDGAEVDGAFQTIAPHPSRPLFAGINHGCCDSASRVSVHDFDGRLLCPPADLYLGDVETGPWDKLTIEADEIRCPGGQKVKVQPSLLEEATSLIQLHARPLLSRYRLVEASDAREDWKAYAGTHGHPPVFAYGDYNDDGFSDLAFLLPLRRPKRTGVGFGLFCLLSQDDQTLRLVTVEEDTQSRLPVHGLAAARPGRRRTVCGLPGTLRAECQGQTIEVTLQSDAIHLYAFESAAALYVWDATQGRFRRVQIAD
jgi:hypothetical protein